MPSSRRLGACAAAVLLGVGFLTPARAAVPDAGDASVAFPIAPAPSAAAALRTLERVPGGGAAREATIRGLAPSPDRAALVEHWAAAHGLRVLSSSAWLVEVRGRADELAGLLGTTVGTVTVHGRAFAVARAALHVPAALRGVVTTPVGLDERPRYHRSYGGGDLQVMHDLPVRGSGAGADVTVGTLNLSGWHPSDMTEFAASYGLRAPAVQSIVVGSGHLAATSAEDASGDEVEVALDAQAIAGTAPAAAQRMYFGANNGADYLTVLNTMADDAAAGLLQVASTSWGLCEADVDPSERAAESQAIARLVTAGATFFAASGDSGAYGCSTPEAPDASLAVAWPAADAMTVGVGGTSVTGVAPSYSTTAWSLSGASGSYAGSGSGGGCSSTVTVPAFQPNVCGGMRAVPDMAALGDPATGLTVFTSHDGWLSVGGTSLAAPVTAAGLAVYLGSQSDRHGVGNILPAAYQNPGAFTDVTSGTNGAYSAGAGYDEVTGLGVPDWRVLGADIHGTTPGPAAPPSSNPWFIAPTVTRSLSVPFAVDYNGGGLANPALRQDTDRGTAAGCPTSPTLAVSPPAAPSDLPTFSLTPGTPDGPTAVTVSGSDPSMGCRATTRTLFLDTHAPTATGTVTYTGTTRPTYTLSWAATDPSPSSGLAGYVVRVADGSTTVLSLNGTTSRSRSFVATAGHTYTLSVTARDVAGNASAVRTITFRAPDDDRSASLSSGWTRSTNSNDYLGSHLASAHAHAWFRFRFTGRSLTAGVIRSRYGGYADLYVDGVRKARFSLYASATAFRQALRLVAFSTRGTHTIEVVVVGAHQAGSLGNAVYLDSLAVGL